MSGNVATTQWSQVLAARDGSDTEARAALESLCQTYWQPLYAYIFDLQLTKGFTLGRVRLQFIGTVINLSDSENATAVCERVNGCGSFDLGDPIAWQHPAATNWV